MKFRGRLFVLIVSVPIIAFAVVGGFMGKAMAREESYQYLRIFEDVITLIMNNYVEEVDADKVMHGAMHGLADGLDPDSAYLDAAQAKAYEKSEPAGSGRTGLELTRQYYLRVVAARDGSPAAKAGLRPGDYVRAIDGQSTRDVSVYEGMRLLSGKPGTKVKLTVLRGNAAEPHDVDLRPRRARRRVAEGPAGATLNGISARRGIRQGHARSDAKRSGGADQSRRDLARHRSAWHRLRRCRSRACGGALVRAERHARLSAGTGQDQRGGHGGRGRRARDVAGRTLDGQRHVRSGGAVCGGAHGQQARVPGRRAHAWPRGAATLRASCPMAAAWCSRICCTSHRARP